MNASGTYRIFLSAVTGELGSYRVEVARVLRCKELEVRDQAHFRQGSATLLEQLRGGKRVRYADEPPFPRHDP